MNPPEVSEYCGRRRPQIQFSIKRASLPTLLTGKQLIYYRKEAVYSFVVDSFIDDLPLNYYYYCTPTQSQAVFLNGVVAICLPCSVSPQSLQLLYQKIRDV